MTVASMEKIDARMAAVAPGTLRHQILVALKQFRASWVELGRLLNEMVYGGDWKECGYDDFEVYCAQELGLKKPTVQKLMVSYNYMRKYEAARLETVEAADGGDVATVPDYQTVELLDRVRRKEAVPEQDIEAVHGRVFGESGAVEDEVAVRRELRGMLRPRLTEDEMTDAAEKRRARLSTVLTAARALRRQLAGCRAVPEGLRERLEVTLVELEALEE